MNRPYGVDRNAAVKLRGVEDAAPYGFYISAGRGAQKKMLTFGERLVMTCPG